MAAATTGPPFSGPRPPWPQFATIYIRVKGAGDQPSPSINLYDFDNIEALIGPVPPGTGNVDVFGPQVTGVAITSAPAYNLFDPKDLAHGALGPTPLVNSLTISFQDLPARAPGFVYPALDPVTAATPGTYVVGRRQRDHPDLADHRDQQSAGGGQGFPRPRSSWSSPSRCPTIASR